MKTILPLVFGLVVASVAIGEEEPSKQDPQRKDFLGKWVGKWDDTWKVQFTVTEDPRSGQLSVLYEVEEKIGKPFVQMREKGEIKKDALVAWVIEIKLSAKDPDKAQAAGKFKQPRTAALTRVKEEGR